MDQDSSCNPSLRGRGFLESLAIAALLLLAVACVFAQTIGYEFVNLDDNVSIYENPNIKQGFTAEFFHWAFTSHLIGNWGPLTWVSHAADWRLYGDWAGGHHLTNVLLHALDTLLLFLVLHKMTARVWPCALATALWAIHPLRAESVAWVTERKDVLSGLFFMLTLWAYVGYARRRSWSVRGIVSYSAMMAFYALGLVSKSILVTLPCLLLLLDYWPLRRLGPPWSRAVVTRRILEKLPLVALAAISCALAVWAEGVVKYPSRGVWWRLGNALLSYVVYLRQFFWPSDLALLYPLRGPDIPVWPVVGAALLLLGITAVAVALMRKCPYLLVGWLWYLGVMLPVVGLVSFGDESTADRFTYLPQIGLCVALAWGAADWCRSLPIRRWGCGVASIAVLAAMMGCTWRQTTYWRNSETLWNRSIACNSENYNAHTMLGISLATNGDTEDAITQFREAVAIIESLKPELVPPSYYQANLNLGIAEASLGRSDEAIACYRKAIAGENPYCAQAQNNLGYALLLRGAAYEALEHLDEALQVNPEFAAAHYNRGLALHALEHLNGAMAEYKEALRLQPDYAVAHFNLGLALEASGRRAEAMPHYQEAKRLADIAAAAQRAKKAKEAVAETASVACGMRPIIYVVLIGCALFTALPLLIWVAWKPRQ